MTDLDLRAGQIHRGLGVVARWPDIALVIPSDASHDAIVDQMFHDFGPEPEAAQIVAAVNELLAADQLKSVAMLVEATGGPLAMAFGPVEVLVDGELVLEGSGGGVRRQVSGTAGRLILRAANLSKAAEPVAPYDLRRGVAPGAGLTLVRIGVVGPSKLDPEAPAPPVPPAQPALDPNAADPSPAAPPLPPSAAQEHESPNGAPVQPAPVASAPPSIEDDDAGEARSIAALAQAPAAEPAAPPASAEPAVEAPADADAGVFATPAVPADPDTEPPVPTGDDEPAPAPESEPSQAADPGSPPEAEAEAAPAVPEDQADGAAAPEPQAPAGVRSGRFDESDANDDPSSSGAERAAPAVEPSPLEVPFRSVVLIGSASPVEPDPLPLAGDAAAPLGPEAIEAGRVEVQGILCTRQHFNNPDAAHCMVCGLSMLHLTNNMVSGLRPTLGFIVFDDGSTYGLDRSYVIGREPRPPDGSSAQLLVLRDNNETLSRTHAILRLDDWSVQLLDLGSTNGTYVWDQGNERWNQLSPGAPVALRSGDTVALGRRTFVFESVSRSS